MAKAINIKHQKMFFKAQNSQIKNVDYIVYQLQRNFKQQYDFLRQNSRVAFKNGFQIINLMSHDLNYLSVYFKLIVLKYSFARQKQ